MKIYLCILKLLIVASLAGCISPTVTQQHITVETESYSRDTLKQQNVETSAEVSVKAEDDWRTEHIERFNLMFREIKKEGEYAVSAEDLSTSVDFGFDLSDLQYEVVKALAKKIFDQNHYTSYEFYTHNKDEDRAMHQETGIEYFVVAYDSAHYWMIVYCQGKAYALYDDGKTFSNARTAEALSQPGEDVLFGFPLKDSSDWVVISTEKLNRDYLVCRVGNPQDKSIVLEYPQDRNNSWGYFTFTIGAKDSANSPQNGDVWFSQSLICDEETFVYTILEESVYNEGSNETLLRLEIENKQTGEKKIHEGNGEMSETTGTLNNKLSDSDKLETIRTQW